MNHRLCSSMLLISVIGLTVSSPAPADLAHIGPIEAPTGFTDIMVLGTLYDVTFHELSFNEVYGSDILFPTLTFTDLTTASAAAEAIAAALNSLSPIPAEVGPLDQSTPNTTIMVPYEITTDQFFAAEVVTPLGSPLWGLAAAEVIPLARDGDRPEGNFAQWSPADDGEVGPEPPVAEDDIYATDRNAVLIVAAPGVLGNDSDANPGDVLMLTTTSVSGPSNGTLTISDDGSFTYTPNPGFMGLDSFTYVATDGTLSSAPATVTITVNNVPPVSDPGGPYLGTLDELVLFDGSGSFDPDGTIIAYVWDFGDGSVGAGPAPTHTYAAGGIYTVTLTVTDNDGTTDTATSTVYIPVPVSIDIKPGDGLNNINPKSKGLVAVAILTTDEFDATTVDGTTVLFGPGEAEPGHGAGHLEDVDEDGDLDLVLHFKIQDSGLALGDTEATLKGELFDGTPIEGTDSVNIVGG
jgi:hypothetical protein